MKPAQRRQEGRQEENREMRGEQNTLKGKLRAREQYSKRNADSKREHRYDSRKRERAQQVGYRERREHILSVSDLAGVATSSGTTATSDGRTRDERSCRRRGT
jgi:hypothetical protein